MISPLCSQYSPAAPSCRQRRPELRVARSAGRWVQVAGSHQLPAVSCHVCGKVQRAASSGNAVRVPRSAGRWVRVASSLPGGAQCSNCLLPAARTALLCAADGQSHPVIPLSAAGLQLVPGLHRNGHALPPTLQRLCPRRCSSRRCWRSSSPLARRARSRPEAAAALREITAAARGPRRCSVSAGGWRQLPGAPPARAVGCQAAAARRLQTVKQVADP